MATYEEVRAAIERLWAGELAEVKTREQEKEQAIAAARETLAALKDRISGCEERLQLILGERDSLPDRPGHATLASDDAEAVALQGRYAELSEEITSVEGEKEQAQADLERIGGDEHFGRAASEHALTGLRSNVERQVQGQYAVLRELLEDARNRARGPRTVHARIRAEEKAALERRAGIETHRQLGLGEPSQGIKLVAR